jgi:hypothetical protein
MPESVVPEGWTMLTMEQFDKIPRTGINYTKQYQALQALPVGKAILLTHDNYKCPNNKSTGCSLVAIVNKIAKLRGLTSSCKHLPDKRIAVAFYGTETK